MKSPFTKGDAVIQIQIEELMYRGKKIEVPYVYYKCLDTGEEFTNQVVDEFNIALLQHYYENTTTSK